jgi:hypothetical protein
MDNELKIGIAQELATNPVVINRVNAAAKIGARRITRSAIAKGAPVAVKASARALAIGGRGLSKALLKISTGPIGVALLAFDVISLALDIWDPAGYNGTLDNAQLEKIRKLYEFEMQKAVHSEGMDWPVDLTQTFAVEIDDNFQITNQADRTAVFGYIVKYLDDNNLTLDDPSTVSKVAEEQKVDVREDRRKKVAAAVLITGVTVIMMLLLLILLL